MTTPERPSRPYRPRHDEIVAAFRLYTSQSAAIEVEWRTAVETCEMIRTAAKFYREATGDGPRADEMTAYAASVEAAADVSVTERRAAAAARLGLEFDALSAQVQP